jgi:hypothetical protein
MSNINPNEASSASQKARILAYMKAGNRITPIEALNLFQCFRLGARIADIKDDGFDVKSEFVKVGPRKKTVKSYWL